MADLQQHLADLAGDGQLESSGVLTIDLARCRARLFESRMADPSMYVLKLVQALVRAGCTSLSFYQSRAGLELLGVCADDTQLPLEDVRRALMMDPVDIPDSALRDLVYGLGGALSLGDGVGFEFRGSRPWTLLSASKLRSRSQSPGYLLRFQRFFDSDREAAVLKKQCLFCPIPIFWNGRLMQRLHSPWPGGPRLLERIELSREEGGAFAYHPTDAALVRQSGALPEAVLSNLFLRQVCEERRENVVSAPPHRLRCHAILSIPFDLTGPTQLILIQNGVSLTPIRLHHDFGCSVVLSGDDYPVDLSLFKPREGPQLDAARLEAQHLIADGAARMCAGLAQTPPSSAGESYARAMPLAGMLVSLGLPLLFGGAGLGLGALGFCSSVMLRIALNGPQPDVHPKSLRDRLRSLAEVMVSESNGGK